MNRERHILERAVRVVAEQTAAADGVIDDAYEVGLGGSHRLTVHAKMLRLELLNVKSALERELATLSLDCRDCGRDVHYVAGLGVEVGHWRTPSRRPTTCQRSDAEPLSPSHPPASGLRRPHARA